MEGSQLFLIENPKKPGKRVKQIHSIVIKVIELFLACASWMTYSFGIGTSCLQARHAVASATFGAFVIVGTIALIGYLLAQPMPRVLQITCDSIAFVLFFSSGMLMVESWWQIAAEMPAFEVASASTEAEMHDANLRLGVGLIAICAAAFHLADAFVNLIRHDLTPNSKD